MREHGDDLARSEQLAHRCTVAWARGERPVDAPDVERVCAAFDVLAERWRALAVGESMTLAWPDAGPGRRHASTARSRARPRGREARTGRRVGGRRR